jgi:Transposase DDE domain
MLSGGQVADCTAGELLLEQMPQASMLHGNAIERMFGRLKDFRRIDTRYDRLADNFLAAVCLAAVVSYWL